MQQQRPHDYRGGSYNPSRRAVNQNLMAKSGTNYNRTETGGYVQPAIVSVKTAQQVPQIKQSYQRDRFDLSEADRASPVKFSGQLGSTQSHFSTNPAGIANVHRQAMITQGFMNGAADQKNVQHAKHYSIEQPIPGARGQPYGVAQHVSHNQKQPIYSHSSGPHI